jgi:hypothetical protein
MTPDQKRAARRAAMPVTTSLMEQYADFAPTLVYAVEGAHTFGKPPQYAEVFAIPANYEPMKHIETKGARK